METRRQAASQESCSENPGTCAPSPSLEVVPLHTRTHTLRPLRHAHTHKHTHTHTHTHTCSFEVRLSESPRHKCPLLGKSVVAGQNTYECDQCVEQRWELLLVCRGWGHDPLPAGDRPSQQCELFPVFGRWGYEHRSIVADRPPGHTLPTLLTQWPRLMCVPHAHPACLSLSTVAQSIPHLSSPLVVFHEPLIYWNPGLLSLLNRLFESTSRGGVGEKFLRPVLTKPGSRSGRGTQLKQTSQLQKTSTVRVFQLKTHLVPLSRGRAKPIGTGFKCVSETQSDPLGNSPISLPTTNNPFVSSPDETEATVCSPLT